MSQAGNSGRPGHAGGPPAGRPSPDRPDVSEKGALRDGQPQAMDRRLFMQLLVFTGCRDEGAVVAAVRDSGLPGVVYADLHDPHGVGILTLNEDPGHFLEGFRAVLRRPPLVSLILRPEMTMFGRTYSLGYEPDLEETLFTRPRRTLLHPGWPWAVWYPLRRNGEFAQLPEPEQRSILMEHGIIGRSFGEADLAHDIRLACHGLDAHDNDFVVGLTGKTLHPLSAIVQTMRRTKQTSLYLERLGPFFVGRALWKSTL